MLIFANRLQVLSFGNLMEVYRESNTENGQELWPGEPPERQLALAEQDFYDYLSQTFFRVRGAFYALWEVDGRYVSALRLEPWKDGWLLSALETAPEHRKHGYAKMLVCGVLSRMEGTKIYSHVSKRNVASLRTHDACGFKKILNHAVYADGSVLSTSVTLMIET